MNVANYTDGLTRFIEASPSAYHAAAEICRQLKNAGFREQPQNSSWPVLRAQDKGFMCRDGAVIAWRAPKRDAPLPPDIRFNVFGCHTDSPGFVLKPGIDFVAHGFWQLAVEVYGGPLLYSWFDRDLCVAGRVITAAGDELLVDTGAVARIPSLAIHLDREANSAFTVNRQKHVQPILGLACDRPEGGFMQILANKLGVSRSELYGVELCLRDTQPPARTGLNEELFTAGRLDNLSSVYAGLTAITGQVRAGGELSDRTVGVFAAFNHEEVGSQTRSGAAGPLLEECVSRLQESVRADAQQKMAGRAASVILSADAGHSLHPNYPEKHDPDEKPVLGGGVLYKQNANQRYISDATGQAAWKSLCVRAGVETQSFVSRNDSPCGSTIGPALAARMGMCTLDAGVPLMAMHSVRELAHVADLHDLAVIAATHLGGE